MSIDWSKFHVQEGADRNWPEKGAELKVSDSVQGRYIQKNENVGKNKSNVYIIETEQGEKVGVWGSTVLDARFADIAIGKLVAIEYVGEKTGKSGNTYKDFKVGVGIDYVGDQPPF